MKNHSYIVLKISTLLYTMLLVGMSPPARACDVCGCAATNYNLTLLPRFDRSFLGVRYAYQRYESHPADRGSYLNTQEIFRSVALTARVYVQPRWQVQALLPYFSNTQHTTLSNKHVSGFGDAFVQANHEVFRRSTVKDSMTALRHSLWLGVGLKLPTGRYRYNPYDGNAVANANFQPGTGSYDPVLTAFYVFRYRRYGLSATATGRLPAANAGGYRFGNQLSSLLTGFYVFQQKKLGLVPAVGLAYETAARSHDRGQPLSETGGHLLALQAGLDAVRGDFIVSVQAQQPFVQGLGGGHLRAHGRLTLQLTKVL